MQDETDHVVSTKIEKQKHLVSDFVSLDRKKNFLAKKLLQMVLQEEVGQGFGFGMERELFVRARHFVEDLGYDVAIDIFKLHGPLRWDRQAD